MAWASESPGSATWTQVTPRAASSARPSRWASASKASEAGSPPAGLEKAMSIEDGSRPASSRRAWRSSIASPSCCGRVQRGRAGRAGEQGRGRERAPAVAPVGHALPGPAAVAADPDRWMRDAHRPGVGGDAAGVEVATFDGDVVAGPDGDQHVEGLVEELVALPVVDAQRRELALEVAGADAEGEAPAGQHVEGGGRLGDHERVPVRQHDDVRDEPKGRGVGRGVAEGDERDPAHRDHRRRAIAVTGPGDP